jgi:hypothetical protein
MELVRILARNVKHHRKLQGMTQEQLALSIEMKRSYVWPAAGLVDTEIGCFHLSEVHNAKKEVQPRVQA